MAHGLGTAEDAGFCGLLEEGVEGRERIIRKVQCEGPHLRVSSNKILQKYDHPTSHYVMTLLSAQNLSDSNFSEAANAVAVMKAALRAVYGHETVRQGISAYDLALEISQTYDGMMVAIPRPHWSIFRSMHAQQLADVLQERAAHVNLRRYKTQNRHRRAITRSSMLLYASLPS